MSKAADFFLTHIDAEFQQHADEILANARKEHKKINDVVNSFRSKVDKMIDKQRIEYIQAYEGHMQDVQRELHTLRDKVSEMANNHTKNERTEKLKAEIIQFKSDALQLETDSDYLRGVMAKTVQKIYTVEKSRDWMLRRLRKAKKEYNNLLKEKSRLLEEASFASLSHDNDSFYTFEFGTGSQTGGETGDKTQSLPNKFKRNVRSHADVKRDLKLPAISTSGTNKNSKPKATIKFRKTDQPSVPLTRDTSIRSLPSMAKSIASVELGGGDDDLGKLIALRALNSEIQQFLSTCKASLQKRPWSKVHRRFNYFLYPLKYIFPIYPNLFIYFLLILLSRLNRTEEDLVIACRRIVDERLHHDIQERNSPGFLSLICELAVLPNTYEVVLTAVNEVMLTAANDVTISEAAAKEEEEDFLAYHNEILNWDVEKIN